MQGGGAKRSPPEHDPESTEELADRLAQHYGSDDRRGRQGRGPKRRGFDDDQQRAGRNRGRGNSPRGQRSERVVPERDEGEDMYHPESARVFVEGVEKMSTGTQGNTQPQGERRPVWLLCIVCREKTHAETSHDGNTTNLVCQDCHSKFNVARELHHRKNQKGVTLDDLFQDGYALPPALREDEWASGQVNLTAIEAARESARAAHQANEDKIQRGLKFKGLWHDGAPGPTSEGEALRRDARQLPAVHGAYVKMRTLESCYERAKALLEKYPQPEAPAAPDEGSPTDDVKPVAEETVDPAVAVAAADPAGDSAGETDANKSGKHVAVGARRRRGVGLNGG